MLELVLALPLLLFIMALIINYGTVSAWKVRANSVARLAVWEARWPRTGDSDPRPSYWPAPATIENSDQGNVAGMDDSRVDLPVARGPMPGTTVNSEVLDPTSGLREGSAVLTRNYPLLRKLGTYTLTGQTWLIDNKWQYQRMGMGGNWQRRIPVLYALAEGPASQVTSYIQSVMAIANATFQAQLAPLSNDPDFIYYGSLFGWGGAPNFYPQIQQMCTTDHKLTDKAVNNLIGQVSRLPKSMGQSFRGEYQRALAAFQGWLNATNPPSSPQNIALAQSQIPQLQTNIGELTKFLQSLQ